MLGKLSWADVPLHQPIPLLAGCVAFGVVGGIAVYVVLKGWAPYLWREWITSVDHKRIGVMYIFLAMVMLLRGFTDAIMMRSQQALAFRAPGYLPPEHYDQIFSAHGTLMILFVAMPFMIGLINIVVPLQLGVRDVAFPTLNSVSFWLTATGALLINLSLLIGEFARTGWLPGGRRSCTAKGVLTHSEILMSLFRMAILVVLAVPRPDGPQGKPEHPRRPCRHLMSGRRLRRLSRTRATIDAGGDSLLAAVHCHY